MTDTRDKIINAAIWLMVTAAILAFQVHIVNDAKSMHPRTPTIVIEPGDPGYDYLTEER